MSPGTRHQAPEKKEGIETVIGLEVHLQFKTKTKIFCGCSNEFGQGPNTNTCPVCLGLPGTLPVMNELALTYAIKVALGLNCTVNPKIKFDRKNYYYPDLPKGYQISQYDLPIASNGFLLVPTSNEFKKIRIHRAHLEEDAGKLIHDPQTRSSLVDYNRTGTPLMEIVSEPDLRTPQEAYDYLTILKLTLSYLDVSDCDMEKGSLRCDANISVRPAGDQKLGTKVEIKNLNSFKAVKTALEHEQGRQRQMLINGERIVQETRLWNEEKQLTVTMRSKEEAHDYRYFPEPDLVPFMVSDETIASVKATLPEPPLIKSKRLQEAHQLSKYDAGILIQDPELAVFFEECVQLYPQAKKICNWLIGPIMQEGNSRKVRINKLGLTPESLTQLICRVEESVVSNLAAKDVLTAMIDTGKTADQIIEEKGLKQVSDDSTLTGIIDEIIRDNPKVIEQIKQGKDSAMGFLVGQAMKKSQGKANPKKINEMIRRKIFQENP